LPVLNSIRKVVLTAHNQINLLTQHVAEGQELTPPEIEQAIHDLLEPKISIEAKAEFLLCLARRGETPREIAGFAIILRELAIDPNIDRLALDDILLDTCGTGGDGANTFNVSTAAAFVLAAAGIPIAKHGNRAITSKCGSADVLEALGIQIEMPPARLKECIHEVKMGFLFAPQYHKTFKVIKPVRQHLAEKGKKSIFNILGPLVNPARPNVQIIGVYDPKLTDLYAQVLSFMKVKRAVVVHGYDSDKKRCLDELSTLGLSKISQLHSSGKIESVEIKASSFGFKPTTLKELQGGDAKANAQIIENIFAGKDTGPKCDLVTFNSALGFVMAKKAKDLHHGLKQAQEIISSGAALEKLNALRKFSAS